jgi:hypothetical protein
MAGSSFTSPLGNRPATPLQRALTSVGRSFHPASLFGATAPGVVYDLADASSLFQDSAGATPITTAGQLIGRVNDKSGRGNHATQGTTGSKMVWQGTYGQCDGFDDFLVTGNIDFTGTDKVTVIAGIRKESDSAAGIVCESGATSDTTAGTFAVGTSTLSGDASRRTYFCTLNGTQAASFGASLFAAPHTAVVSSIFDIAGADRATEITPRVNGAIPTLTGGNNASAGTGNFSSQPIYIGRRGGSSSPFNGRLYRLIVIGRALTASELSQAERWSAQPMGITL